MDARRAVRTSPCSPIASTSAASGRKARTTLVSPSVMQPEIVERVGVAALDDRIGFGGQFRSCSLAAVVGQNAQQSRPAAPAASPAGAPARTRSRRTPFEQEETEQAVAAACRSCGHSRLIGHGLAVGGQECRGRALAPVGRARARACPARRAPLSARGRARRSPNSRSSGSGRRRRARPAPCAGARRGVRRGSPSKSMMKTSSLTISIWPRWKSP